MIRHDDPPPLRKPFPPSLIGALLGWANLVVLLLAIAKAAPTPPGDDAQPDYDALLVFGIIPATFFGWILGVVAGALAAAPPDVRRFALLCLGLGAWLISAPGGTAADIAFPSWLPTIAGVLILERVTRARAQDVLPLARLR